MKDPTRTYTQGSIVGLIIGAAIGIALGWWIATDRQTPPPAEPPQAITITEPQPAAPDTTITTVTRRLPLATQQGLRAVSEPSQPATSDTAGIIARTDTIRVPATEASDSADVIIPITRRVYTDTTHYRAVIEGYESRLISLDIYPQPTPPPEHKHWHLGPSVGLGWDGHHIAPFLGLTLTYSLISF